MTRPVSTSCTDATTSRTPPCGDQLVRSDNVEVVTGVDVQDSNGSRPGRKRPQRQCMTM